MKLIKLFLVSFFLINTISVVNAADFIDDAVASNHRSDKNKARDIYRHPAETLRFFGLKEDMHVLEILPGRAWYTEILAPALKEKGSLTAASFGGNHPNDYLRNIHNEFTKTMAANADIYGKVKLSVFEEGDVYLKDVADNSQDMVVTFRNTHNWIRFGGIEEAFSSFHRVLKKGGVLGVVQHRANEGADVKESAQKGYVTETYLIKLLEGMGFELVDKSEVNANAKDTKDHPEGVWTLPPSYRLKDVDKEKYTAIGESDRMTLRFVKL
jgi:predicted methyltransferase